MQKRDRESQQGEQPEQEEAAEAKEKSPASDSPPMKKKAATAAPSAVDASDAPSAAEVPATVAAPVSGAAAAAELPKKVWFKYGETVSFVELAVDSYGAELIKEIVKTLAQLKCQHGPIAVSLPESLANKLQRFCLEGSAELNPRATLDSEFFRELGKQALVVTERTPSSVAVKVCLDHTVATIEGLRLGSSTVGDLKVQAVRVLSGPNERAADYSLFFDTTQPTIIWGSAADSAAWLDKFCEGIPAASADLAAAEKSPRKLKGDMTLDHDFFRVVKGNVEIILRRDKTAASVQQPEDLRFSVAALDFAKALLRTNFVDPVTGNIVEDWTPGSIIDLRDASSNSLLGFETKGPVWIRPAFVALKNAILPSLAEGSVLVTGTPGTGKSLFGILMIRDSLKSLVQNGSPAVFVRRSLGEALFEHDSSAELHLKATAGKTVLPLVQNRTFFDKGPGAEVPSQDELARKSWFLATSSPNASFAKLIAKVSSTPFFLPRWSCDELCSCCEATRLGFSREEISRRFNRFGGTARTVFRFSQTSAGQKQEREQWDFLTSGLKKDTLVSFFAAVNLPFSQDSKPAIDRLVHIDSEDFKTGRYVWASKDVLDLATSQLISLTLDELRKFTEQLRGVPTAHSFLGSLFERNAHRTFSASGVFSLRSLKEGEADSELSFREAPSVVEFSVSGKNLVSKDKQLVIEKGKYYRPSASNFEGIDAFFVKPDDGTLVFFQMTISEHHPVKQKELERIFSLASTRGATPAGSAVWLIFVVPQQLFSVFKEQAFVVKKGSKQAGQLNAVAKNAKQFVLGLPFF